MYVETSVVDLPEEQRRRNPNIVMIRPCDLHVVASMDGAGIFSVHASYAALAAFMYIFHAGRCKNLCASHVYVCVCCTILLFFSII